MSFIKRKQKERGEGGGDKKENNASTTLVRWSRWSVGEAKNRISGDIKRCLGTAVSGTSNQVTSYLGARPPDAFTRHFVSLRSPPTRFFLTAIRVFKSVSRVPIITSGLLFCPPLRDDRLPTKIVLTITSGSKSGILSSHLMIMYAPLCARRDLPLLRFLFKNMIFAQFKLSFILTDARA